MTDDLEMAMIQVHQDARREPPLRDRAGGSRQPWIAILLTALVLLVSACDAPGQLPPGVLGKLPGFVRIHSLAWAPDGVHLAVGALAPPLAIWNLSTQRSSHRETNIGPVLNMAWSPDNEYLATVSNEPTDTLRVWDTQTWQRISSPLRRPEPAVSDVAWAPTGHTLAVSYGGGPYAVRLWNVATHQFTTNLDSGDHPTLVRWSPNEAYLAIVGRGADRQATQDVVKVVDVAQGQIVTTFTTPGLIWGMAWAPDSQRLAWVRDDAAVQIWAPASGQPPRTFSGQTVEGSGVAWSPDGRRVASGAWDQTIWIRDGDTGRLLKLLQSGSDALNTIAWSPDGAVLASGGDDGDVWLWDAK